MVRAAALLRGVNVSGRNTIAMRELRALFVGLGCEEVETYVQSGNVVFTSVEVAPDEVVSEVRWQLESVFGVSAVVFVRSGAELAGIVAGNPLLAEGAEQRTSHVTFLEHEPDPALVEAVPAAGTADQFRVLGREVYLDCPGGYGKTKLNNAFWERRLKVAATTRNWRTVTTLADMTR